MSTPEQAEQVLNNPAFKNACEELENSYLDDVKMARDRDEMWEKRLKYDAILSVLWELQRKIQDTSRDAK